jgi:hypothetical protein
VQDITDVVGIDGERTSSTGERWSRDERRSSRTHTTHERMTDRDAQWELPFTREEYAERLARTREEMARRGVELLYVTSPPNLYYLLGHQSVWWDGRNVTGLAVPLDAAVKPIMFDTWDHSPGWSPIVEDGVTYGEEGFYYPEGPQVVAATLRDRGLLKGRVGVEWWSWAPGGPALQELAGRLAGAGAREVVDGSWIVDHVRLVKSPKEVEYTRKALEIADAAYEALAAALAPGMSEKEIMGLLYYECAKRGGDEPGIRMMVRTGPNTFNFHHPATERRIEQGELLMIDMSATYHHYHGNTAQSALAGREPLLGREAREARGGAGRDRGEAASRRPDAEAPGADGRGGRRSRRPARVRLVGRRLRPRGHHAARLGRPRLPQRRGGLREGRLRARLRGQLGGPDLGHPAQGGRRRHRHDDRDRERRRDPGQVPRDPHGRLMGGDETGGARGGPPAGGAAAPLTALEEQVVAAVADGRDELVALARELVALDTTARETGDPPRDEDHCSGCSRGACGRSAPRPTSGSPSRSTTADVTGPTVSTSRGGRSSPPASPGGAAAAACCSTATSTPSRRSRRSSGRATPSPPRSATVASTGGASPT